ncbi:hypothetical protein [Dactylosporangium matsuzakiense]|uniref:Uncharacterized protein n=1 Tax=Dactylosporangium matsuzakiense TaxID=53360 RepID=A0A9W6NRV1_9ACTN|nr:hypothetical protein [Dactylosporangium matsuzakiense]UWZ41432.1 hypothetical protein Dmats_27615 [Dactylosporangium matsuzakiense]GLL06989.1 hypothetical protein GCM10017581_087400 [Dactylosporangium matsuzakiense]
MLPRRITERTVGGLLGLAGHVLAAQVFLDEALRGHVDPQDRVMGAMFVVAACDILYSAVCLTVVGVCFRRGHRDLGSGILLGWLVGAVPGLVAAVTVYARTSDWSSHCPCEPPLQDGQQWWDFPWTWATARRVAVWFWPVVVTAGIGAAYCVWTIKDSLAPATRPPRGSADSSPPR